MSYGGNFAAGLPPALARRFEAIVFDWDGTAVPDRHARRRRGPRSRGASVPRGGRRRRRQRHPRRQRRRSAPRPADRARAGCSSRSTAGRSSSRSTERAPPGRPARRRRPTRTPRSTRAAERDRRAARGAGIDARIVSQRLNRRKIDLLPDPEWADPPKAEIDQRRRGGRARLRAAGIDGLVEAARIALDAAPRRGLRRAQGDERRQARRDRAHRQGRLRACRLRASSGPTASRADQVLIGGDEFGPLGGLVGSDSMMLVAEADARDRRARSASSPKGSPTASSRLPGGPAAFVALARRPARAAQRRSRASRTIPRGRSSSTASTPPSERAHESLLAIADGMIGTTAAPLLVASRQRAPRSWSPGIYDGAGAETALLPAPRWAFARRRAAAGRSDPSGCSTCTPACSASASRAPRRSTRSGSSRWPDPGVACLRARRRSGRRVAGARAAASRAVSIRPRRSCTTGPGLDGDARDGRIDHRRRVAGARRYAPRSCRRVRRPATDGPRPEDAARSASRRDRSRVRPSARRAPARVGAAVGGRRHRHRGRRRAAARACGSRCSI